MAAFSVAEGLGFQPGNHRLYHSSLPNSGRHRPGGMGCGVCEGSETYSRGILSLGRSSSPVAMVLSYGVGMD